MAIPLVTKQFEVLDIKKRQRKILPKIFFLAFRNYSPLPPSQKTKKAIENSAELDKPNPLLLHLFSPPLRKVPIK